MSSVQANTALILASGWTKPSWAWAPFAFSAQQRGYAVLRPEYPSWGLQKIEKTASAVKREILEARESYDRVVFIGHSMGGLIGRYLYMTDPEVEFDGYISIGTPHMGTPLAKWAFFSGAAWDMRPDSPFLADLAALKWPEDLPTLTIRAEYDVIVPDCTFCGDEIVIPKSTHTAVLLETALHQAIFGWLERNLATNGPKKATMATYGSEKASIRG